MRHKLTWPPEIRKKMLRARADGPRHCLLASLAPVMQSLADMGNSRLLNSEFRSEGSLLPPRSVTPSATRSSIDKLAIGALATGAFATGARAIGAFALGAFAIGTLALGRAFVKRLVVRDLRIRSLEIDELRVSRIVTADGRPLLP